MSTERDQFLIDIFHGIFEDYGTNSWRFVTKYRWDGLGYKSYYGQIKEVGDGDENELHDVNREIIQRGLQKIIRNEVKIDNAMQKNIAEASRENDAGQIDAYDADMILQAGIFGKLRYG